MKYLLPVMILFLRLSVAAFCFLVGVASHHLYFARSHTKSEPARKTASVTQGYILQSEQSPNYPDSKPGLAESIMARLGRSVRGSDPAYRFQRAICTCPGIIPNQQSYHYGDLYRGNEFVADVYIAEATSARDAAKWMIGRGHAGAERFVAGLSCEAYRLKNQDGNHSSTFIRSGRIVIQISGEANATEALTKYVLEQLSAT